MFAKLLKFQYHIRKHRIWLFQFRFPKYNIKFFLKRVFLARREYESLSFSLSRRIWYFVFLSFLESTFNEMHTYIRLIVLFNININFTFEGQERFWRSISHPFFIFIIPREKISSWNINFSRYPHIYLSYMLIENFKFHLTTI